MASEETKHSQEMKQLEEIERMLEKATRLRVAAAARRVGLDAAEKEESNLRERVREWEKSHGRSKE